MGKSIILLVILINGFSFNTIAQDTTLLENYLIIAAQNNLKLKSKFNNYLVEVEKINQVGTLPDPQFSFNYFISPIETKVGPQQFNLQLKQKLPWFGEFSHLKESQKLVAEAKYQDIVGAKSNLFFDVKTAYYKLYFNQKSVKILEENLQLLQIVRAIVISRVETGKSTLADVYRIEIQQNELQNQKEQLDDNWNSFVDQLRYLMNDPGLEINVVDSLPTTNWFFEDSINLTNPEIIRMQKMIAAFEANELIVSDKGKPQVSVGLGYTSIGDGGAVPNSGKDAWMFPAVSISLPIFREKYTSEIKQLNLKEEALSSQISDKSKQLQKLIADQYRKFQDANRRISLYEKQIQLSKKSLSILLEAYAAERASFDEVMQMEKLILNYSLLKEKALIDQKTIVAFVNVLYGF